MKPLEFTFVFFCSNTMASLFVLIVLHGVVPFISTNQDIRNKALDVSWGTFNQNV